MVVHHDPKRLASPRDRARRRDVARRWTGRPRRMIVREDQGGRARRDDVPHDLSRMDLNAINRTFPHEAIGDEAIFAIEVEDAKSFPGQPGHLQAKVIRKGCKGSNRQLIEGFIFERVDEHRRQTAQLLAGRAGKISGIVARARPQKRADGPVPAKQLVAQPRRVLADAVLQETG